MDEFEEIDFTPIENFLSTEAQIAEVNKWLQEMPTALDELKLDRSTKEKVIQEKISRLHEELDKLRNKYWEAESKIHDDARTKRSQLASLREAKAREEMQAQFQKTAELIKEIVADYATWKKLREYQIEDVVATVHQFVLGDSGLMNCNEMALGKTVEAIASLYIIRSLFFSEHGRYPKVLWLTKSSIVKTGGTIAELERWDDTYKMIPLDGSAPVKDREFTLEMYNMLDNVGLITNYEACRTTKGIQDTKWDIVLFDEVHKLKGGANPTGPTAVWTAVKDVCKNARFMIMLTGTPLVNKPEEMWSYLHIFAPEEFPSARDFTRRFTGFRQAAGQFKMSIDAEKLFRTALKGRLIRRTAAEVGLQLPQVIREDVMLDHNEQQGEIYKQMKEQFFIWLDTTSRPLTANNILTQLIRLRQINVLPVATFYDRDEDGNIINTIKLDVRDSSKLDQAVHNILEHDTQAVGFCCFNEPLNELAFRLQVEGKSVAVISSQTSNQMGSFEVDFQAGKLDVLLINSAMGEGLNLHRDPEKWSGGAGYGFTLDRWYNNARNDQCFKRIVRPGAPGPIFFDDFYCDNSVDEYIRILCDEKDEMFNNVTENKAARTSGEWKDFLGGLL